MIVPCSESVVSVVVVLLLNSKNDNNNSYRIIQDHKKAVANLVHSYWHLHPVEIVHCSHLLSCVNRQCYGVLVLRLPVKCMHNSQAVTHVNYKDYVNAIICCPSR